MPPKKRQAPATPETSGRRRSGRISSSGKKSVYFEADSDDELGDDQSYHTPKRIKSGGSRRTSAVKRAKVEESEEDAYQDEESDDDGGEGSESDEYHSAQEEQEVKIKKKRKSQVSNGDVEDEDEDEDGDDDGPQVTFIPHKQLRDLDGVDYEDGRIHKNTLLFLRDLRANNLRSWLKCMDFLNH